MRFTGLSANDLWVDESCTYYAESHLFDLPCDGPPITREIAHLPYVLLLHGWSKIAGQTPTGLRSFSAVVGCVGVLAMAWLAWMVGGTRCCLIAAALTALHPLHIHYSQEARVYALWMLEGTLGVAFLFQAAQHGRFTAWLAYFTLAIVAVLTHYYTLLWLPATITTLIIAADRRRFLKQWLVVHGLLVVVLAPIVWLMVLPFSAGGPRPWLEKVWQGYPPSLAIAKSFWTMLPAGGYPAYLGSTAQASAVLADRIGLLASQIVRYLPAGLTLALLLTAILRSRAKNKPNRDNQRSPKHGSEPEPVRSTCPSPRRKVAAAYALPEADPNPGAVYHPLANVAWLLLLPATFLGSCWIWSALVRPIYVVGRYDVFAMPSVLIAVALLASKPGWASGRERGKHRPTTFSWVVTVLLLTSSLAVVLAARTVPASRDISKRAARIARYLDPNDLLICIGASRWFMTYEWDRLGVETHRVSYPRCHDRQLCWDDPEAELTQPRRLDADLIALNELVQSTLAKGNNVWLLLRGETADSRWKVDRRFFAFLRRAGLAVDPVDEDAGLALIRPMAGSQ